MAVVEGKLFVQLYCCTVYNLREFWEGTAVASNIFFCQGYFLSFSCSFMGSWSLLLLLGPWRKTLDFSYFQEAYLTYRKDLHTLPRVRNGTFAWRIPGTEEPGGLPSVWSNRVRHDWSDLAETDKELTTLQSFWGKVRKKSSSLFSMSNLIFLIWVSLTMCSPWDTRSPGYLHHPSKCWLKVLVLARPGQRNSSRGTCGNRTRRTRKKCEWLLALWKLSTHTYVLRATSLWSVGSLGMRMKTTNLV